jgi:hypothetical protein
MRRHILAVALSCVAVQPSVAAAPACVTPEIMEASLRGQLDPHLHVTTYVGLRAKQLATVMEGIATSAPPPGLAKRTETVAIFEASVPGTPILYTFYDAQRCRFAYTQSTPEEGRAILKEMGTSI